MKRIRFIFCSLVLIFMTPRVFSQSVMFVEDLTAIATAISNGYTMYQQLMNNIEQIEATYKQLENTAKQMASYDWGSFESGEGLKNIDNFIHAADGFMDLQDNLSDLIDSKNMQIGGFNFSLKDLYSTDFLYKCMSEAEMKMDPRNITEEEQKEFMARHGISLDHYNKFINIEKQISLKSQQTKVVTDKASEVTKNLRNTIKDLPLKTEGEKENMDIQLSHLKAQSDAALIQVDLTASLLDTTSNLAQLILEEHNLRGNTVEQTTAAREEFESAYGGDYYVNHDNEKYLHLWNSSW